MARTLAAVACGLLVTSAARGDEVPTATLAVLGLADLQVQEVDVRSSPWQFCWGPDEWISDCRDVSPLDEYTLPTLTFLRRRLTKAP